MSKPAAAPQNSVESATVQLRDVETRISAKGAERAELQKRKIALALPSLSDPQAASELAGVNKLIVTIDADSEMDGIRLAQARAALASAQAERAEQEQAAKKLEAARLVTAIDAIGADIQRSVDHIKEQLAIAEVNVTKIAELSGRDVWQPLLIVRHAFERGIERGNFPTDLQAALAKFRS